MFSSSGAEGTVYSSGGLGGVPPCFFTRPLHLYNIDDEGSVGGGGGGSSAAAVLQPILDHHSFHLQHQLARKDDQQQELELKFSFLPLRTTAPGDHGSAAAVGQGQGPSLPIPLSSFFFQSLTEEANLAGPLGNGSLPPPEFHFAPEATHGEGENEDFFGEPSLFGQQFSPTTAAAGFSPPNPTLPTFGSQASTPHNRRMIFPYLHKKGKGGKENSSFQHHLPTSSSNSAATGGSATSTVRDEPKLLYRFFEFHCTNCEQSWLSPLFRAKNGCFCRHCHHFIMPRGIRHSFTPYLGKETCYGKYTCHLCKRGWSSYKSMSNCPDQCFECGTLVYPYYQVAHSVLYQKINKNEQQHEINLSGNNGAANSSSSSPAKSAFLKRIFTHHHQQSPNTTSQSSSAGRNNNNTGGVHQQQINRRLFGLPRKITSISGIPQTATGNGNNNNGNGRAPLPLIITAENLRAGITTTAGIGNNNNGIIKANKKRLHCPNNSIPFLRQAIFQVRRNKSQLLKSCFSEPIIPNSN